MERLSINDDDGEVAARWLSTLEETKRMAARHVSDVAAAAAEAALGGDDTWVDVAAGRENEYASRKQSSSSPSTSTTGVPRDSGDAWRQEEWHIAFVVLFFEAPAAALRSGGDHSDDLLFFVLSEREAASRSCAAAAAAAANASGAAGAAARGASASASASASAAAEAAPLPGPRGAARRALGGVRSGGGGGGGGTGSGSGGGITNDVGDCGALLVRRRTAKDRPPAGFGLGEANAAAVDWRATVLLNLSLQSSYALAVVACRKGALRDSSSSVPRAIAAASSSAAAAAAAAAAKQNEKGGGTHAAATAASSETSTSGPLPPLALPLGGHGVRHDVFASPMRLAFEITGGGGGGGMSGSSGPEPSYPEICFSVDSEAGFGAASSSSSPSSSSSHAPPLSSLSSELELASPGDVFAVFLVATGGPALATGPAEAAAKEEGGGGEKEQQPKEQEREKKESFVEIFSGFVSYEQLAAALPCAKIATASSSGSSGGGGDGNGRREHVRMRGPGGQGVADVAVSVLFRKDASAPAPSSSGRDLVARTVAARDGHDAAAPYSSSSSSALAATARALLRAAAAAVAPPSQRTPPAGPPVFGCSLFCLSLPVETLAGRLLGLPDFSSSSSSQ